MTGLLARRRARREDAHAAIDNDADDWVALLRDDDVTAPAHAAGAHPYPFDRPQGTRVAGGLTAPESSRP
ncbi:hypothetical protein ACIBKY_17455 [Nonomuraea sp. NPDC050394]|uniref:hypothetical protein n=1 Tax=Nonomuraea sp. NPDC050394 TaxID=3364363 RepID=UPI0037AD62BA